MKIIYLGHSGFAVKTGSRTLVFDDIDEDFPEPEDAIAFVSHAHGDHLGRAVRAWNTPLIAGCDVRPGNVRMREGDAARIGDVDVTAFGSTDEGVSFLVESDGWRVFHAGDFNLWHWRSESTKEEIAEAEEAFWRILRSIRGRRIDVAFFPVDPRMGEGCDEGAEIFLREIRPDLLIPMHFWDRPDAAISFAQRHGGACAMTRHREAIIVERGRDGHVYVQSHEPERGGSGQEPEVFS